MTANLAILPQAAAIPIYHGRVCLITSRSGKRWLVPKGCMEPGKSTTDIALQEAWEEAGLIGTLDQQPIGCFEYEKAGQHYRVTVYLMHVRAVHDQWPERGWRARVWLSPDKAEARIDHAGLRLLLRQALAGAELAATA